MIDTQAKFSPGDLVFVTRKFIMNYYAVDYLNGVGGIIINVINGSTACAAMFYYEILFLGKIWTLEEEKLQTSPP